LKNEENNQINNNNNILEEIYIKKKNGLKQNQEIENKCKKKLN